ncbi:MAG: co-chaperone GroES [Pseudomonadota bacterium]
MNDTSGIKSLDLRLLVKPDSVQEKTAGGIFLPDDHKEREKFAACKATVVNVGDLAFSEWKEAVEPGERILIAKYAGTIVKGADGEEYRIINNEDVLARLDQ